MDQNGSAEKRIKYIYSLPFIERTELCRILDQNNKWKNLAGIIIKFKKLQLF